MCQDSEDIFVAVLFASSVVTRFWFCKQQILTVAVLRILIIIVSGDWSMHISTCDVWWASYVKLPVIMCDGCCFTGAGRIASTWVAKSKWRWRSTTSLGPFKTISRYLARNLGRSGCCLHLKSYLYVTCLCWFTSFAGAVICKRRQENTWNVRCLLLLFLVGT